MIDLHVCFFKSKYMFCYVMFLWGVVVLEHCSHPNHNKELDKRTFRMSYDPTPT